MAGISPPVKLGNPAWGEDTYLAADTAAILGWPFVHIAGDPIPHILCSSYSKASLVSGVLGEELAIAGEILEIVGVSGDEQKYIYRGFAGDKINGSCIVLVDSRGDGFEQLLFSGGETIIAAHLPRGFIFWGWLDYDNDVVPGNPLKMGVRGSLRLYDGEAPATSLVDKIVGFSLSTVLTGATERKRIKVCVA